MLRPTWRLKLDVPHTFAVEPGYVRATHCHDFRRGEGTDWQNVWQDPNTGLLGLLPSFLTEQFYRHDYWRTLPQWTTEANRWLAVHGTDPWVNPDNPGADPSVLSLPTARFWTSVDDGSNAYGTLLDNAVGAGVAVANQISAYSADTIKLVMATNNPLVRDEGWVWNYYVHGDERHRPRNWMYWQFGHIGIHFSYDGTCRAYIYENGLTNPPRLIDEWEMCSPGDIINKSGYIVIIPIPGYGLSMYHSHSAQRIDAQHSSAVSGAVRGHLVRVPPLYDGNGLPYVYESAPLYLGVGAVIGRVHYTFGMHNIRYPENGSYLGEVWDPGYVPSQAPDVDAIFAAAAPGTGGVDRFPQFGGTLAYKRDGTPYWTVPTTAQAQERQGRLYSVLSTTDARYTPWLLGTFLKFRTVTQTRNTVAFKPWKVEHLEWSEDEMGRIEGTATCLHKGNAERFVVERGDTTWLIERSDNGGVTWVVQGGGIARLAQDAEAVWDGGGLYYNTTWKLGGMETRFDEIHQQIDTAFDRVNVADGINVVLGASGFTPIPQNELPPELLAIVLPAAQQGEQWKFGTREGDDGGDIIRNLLLFARTQHQEWRARYVWEQQKWTIEKRPHDFLDPTKLYRLTPYSDEVNKAARWLRMASLKFWPYPPEANIVQAMGLTSPDNKGSRVTSQPTYNNDSLTNIYSPDYLGRVALIKPLFTSISDPLDLARMAVRVAFATFPRRIKASATTNDYVDGLRPNVRVRVRGENDNRVRGYLFSLLPDNCLWVKRRTVTIDYLGAGETAPLITLALDSQWLSEITK